MIVVTCWDFVLEIRANKSKNNDQELHTSIVCFVCSIFFIVKGNKLMRSCQEPHHLRKLTDPVLDRIS